MKAIATYIVSGVLLSAMGLCMLISPRSLATIAMAIVAVYLIIDGIKSLVFTRKDENPKNLFVIICIRNAIEIIGGSALLVLDFAMPQLQFSVIVFALGAILVLSSIVCFMQFFANGRNYLAPGAFVDIALALVLFLYPFIMDSSGFPIAAAIIFSLGAVCVTIGCCRIKLRSDVSDVLIELGSKGRDITTADVSSAIDNKLLGSSIQKSKDK